MNNWGKIHWFATLAIQLVGIQKLVDYLIANKSSLSWDVKDAMAEAFDWGKFDAKVTKAYFEKVMGNRWPDKINRRFWSQTPMPDYIARKLPRQHPDKSVLS